VGDLDDQDLANILVDEDALGLNDDESGGIITGGQSNQKKEVSKNVESEDEYDMGDLGIVIDEL
jgi:hypothetical protein